MWGAFRRRGALVTPTQLTGSTFRGGLLRGAIAGGVALLVVYGVLFLTSGGQTATAAEACSNGTVVPNPASNPGLVSDCEALLAIRDVLVGDMDTTDWHPMGNWNGSTAIKSWRGVRVSGTPRRVTRLDFGADGLEGTLPAQLGALTKLERLSLGWNQLTGPIPAELGNLSSLTRLVLRDNRLTGSIPTELGNLTELEHLQLQVNRLTGPIPPELGSLADLIFLELDSNSLTGSIPPELGDLSELLVLSLSGNSLTGCVPLPLKDVPIQDLSRLGLPDCPPRHTLTTSAGANGSIDPAAGAHRYDEDTSVTVTATPDEGYRIASWGDDCNAASGTTCTLTMDADKTASVTFEALPQHTLTTSAGANGSIDPAAGEHSYAVGTSVTVTATPDAGYRIASWGDDCSQVSGTTCELTMDADKTASVTFEPATHTLTVTEMGAGGSVTPAGTTTHDSGTEVTLTASWNDATHSFTGWGGGCSGTSSTCVLTMDADKTVTATFAALPATRCATTTAADCIRAVYKGAPDDYAQVTDIPADLLLTANSDGRYYVERGQQYTVVTAALLPTGWTRFYLDRSPQGKPYPVSAARLIPPVGTTYTFTVSEDEAAATLITYDLKRARPFVRPRPDGKPEIGDTVVTTVFSVEADTLSYNAYDTTGAVTTAGSYAFLSDPDDTSTAVTTYEALRDGTTTALLIHKFDAHGASQTALYDSVETGHLIEWHKADDCFVRYRVTDVPEAEATATHREFGVRWETYVFQGCQTGSVPTSATVTFKAAAELPLEHLGGTSLTDFAVVHGAWQLTPHTQPRPGAVGNSPASIALQPVLHLDPGRQPDFVSPMYTTELADAQALRYWREPEWPTGWTFWYAEIGDMGGPVWGYSAGWFNADGYPAARVWGYYADVRRSQLAASWLTNHSPPRLIVREIMVIAGRPAWVLYSPLGEQHHPSGTIVVAIFDPATETVYEVMSSDRNMLGANLAPVIAIARSLFEGANPR